MRTTTIQSAPALTTRARRGSTIIVAVGVLAVLALVAVSYAIAVRTDRTGVVAYEGGVDLETSSRIVRDDIGALLTADLFGNKIVTPDVPLDSTVAGQPIRIWPRMFEDGEHFDAPRTSPGTFDTRSPDVQLSVLPSPGDPWVIAPETPGGIPPYFPSAPNRDDAWLSNVEPFNPSAPLPRDAGHLDWSAWGQFSNLLSAYQWTRLSSSDRVGVWVRGDGRFADLGQFFLSNDALNIVRTRGDPGAELSYADSTNGDDAFTGDRNGPLVGLGAASGGPTGIATRVFDYQLHQLGEVYSALTGSVNAPELNGYDERFFTDTDGDYRADARWQVLPSLDGLFGMRWVVAARIIDNSALVNVNTALEFQDPETPTSTGDGRTPADVDLYRLVRAANLGPDLRTPSQWSINDMDTYLQIFEPTSTNSFYNAPRDMGYDNPFNQHLELQLGFVGFTAEMDDANRAPRELVWSLSSGDASTLFTDSDEFESGSNPPAFTTRLQRYMANRYFGVTPNQPLTETVTTYPLTAEAELRSFFGVNNNSVISKVEQRFDAGYLDDGSGTLSGPFRAKENTNDARRYAADPTIPGQDRPTILAIATDTRRHLTTVSGTGEFSPVPVLNRAEINGVSLFQQPYNAKISFHDVPRASPNTAATATPEYQTARKNRDKVVRDAFSAFAWALAPLAGHTPLMAPLDTRHTGWGLVANQPVVSRFMYGGDATGVAGPAHALAQQMGPTMGVDPAASYAILRAASLAVNLADATDNEGIDPTTFPWIAPSSGSAERPTVARLYNIVHPAPYEIDGGNSAANGLPALATIPATGPITDNVVRMGVSFPWGDLRNPAAPGNVDARLPGSHVDLLPEEYVGQPVHGVTLAGLDRQPFLREVATYAVYADYLALRTGLAAFNDARSDQLINPAEQAERVGSIIAWEVGNPWSTPIDVTEYQFALATNGGEVLTFVTSGIADRVIDPGEHVVFYAVHWDDGDLDATTFMDSYENQWRSEVEARLGSDNVRRVANDGDVCLTGDDLMLVDDPIPFQDWGNGSAVGLIYIDGSANNTIPGAGRIVLDRISGDGANLPRVLSAGHPLSMNAPSGQKYTGVMTMAASLARPTETPEVGFPAYVIERPSENQFEFTAVAEIFEEWTTDAGGAGGFGPDPGSVPATQASTVMQDVTATFGEETKGTISVAVPSFQLFVPNTELRYTSELLQLTAFTHMYVHDNIDANGASLGGRIADPEFAGPGTWRTVSEQLGSDGEIYRDSPGTSRPNQHLGVLDPTRFVLSNATAGGFNGVLGPVVPNGGAGLPEALALPLALRVLDCFEPLWTPDWRAGSTLVQGRVNINTAAEKTLRMLPLMDPFSAIGPLLPSSAESGSGALANDWRVPLVMAYRDRLGNAEIPNVPGAITELMGITSDNPLRRADSAVESGSFVGTVDLTRGFVTAGELAILGRWDATAEPTPNYGGASFLQLGAGGQETDLLVPTLDVRLEDNAGIADSIVRATPLNGGSLAAYEGADDVEERLALYRAVSNIATARSDVYTAYFKVRGYTPTDIEAVDLPDSGTITEQNIETALSELRPRFEGRYLAVFDRSNVRTPVDRPKVLLFVRLPD